MRGRRLRTSWPVGIYLLAAGVLFAPLLGHLTTRSIGGNDADLFAWWLAATPASLLHGHLPFTSSDLFAPSGINAMWNTSVIALGVLAAPLTLGVGPLASLNVLLFVAPVLSAWAAYRLARRYSGVAPAGTAGLLYGFSPYFVGQAAHLHLTFAVFPPLLVGLLLEAVVHQRARAHRLGLLLGVVIAVQLLVSEELLATSAVLAGMTMVILAARFRAGLVARLSYLGRVTAVAAMTATLLAALPLSYQFFGPQRPIGPIQAHHPGADLLAFLIPTRLQLVHPEHPGRVLLAALGSNLSEQTAYMGLPMAALVVVAIYRLRGTGWSWLGLPLVLAGILTLGSRLTVGGHVFAVPLPAAGLADLPVFASIIPVRFSIYVFLFAALLTAAVLERRPVAPAPRAGLACLVILVLVSLLPARPFPAYPASTPRFFLTRQDVALIPRGGPLLVAPWPSAGYAAPMLWQANARMRLRLIGGYGVVPGGRSAAVFQRPEPLIDQIVGGVASGTPAPPVTTALARRLAAEARGLRATAILIGPSAYDVQAAALLASLLDVPARHIDGVWLLVLSRPPHKGP